MATTLSPLLATDYQSRFGNETNAVSVQLCKEVISRKLTKPFQLYMALKLRCVGELTLDKETVRDLAETIGRTQKTVYNNLIKLKELNWVGQNPKTGTYFIRGFHRLKETFGITSYSKVKFDNYNIRDTQAWLFSAVVTHQDTRLCRRRIRHQVRYCSRTSPCDRGFSIKLMSMSLLVPKSTASRWKIRSRKSGLMFFCKKYAPFNMPWRHCFLRAEYDGMFQARLKSIKGKPYIRISDMLTKHAFQFTSGKSK